VIKYKISRRDFSMGKKIEKGKNEIVEEFFRRNDPKNIKSMNDMYTAWKDFFAPAFQQLLDAEMEAKIGYSKNERTDNNNYRNGYYLFKNSKWL
jgi:transposase-like protein